MNSLEKSSSLDLFLNPIKIMRTNENVNRSNLVAARGPHEEKLVQMACAILRVDTPKRLAVKAEQVHSDQSKMMSLHKKAVIIKERLYIEIICSFYNNGLANRLTLLKKILSLRCTSRNAMDLFQKHFKVDDETESKVKQYLNWKEKAARTERQAAHRPKIAFKVVPNGSISRRMPSVSLKK